jgi:hypothetical protein
MRNATIALAVVTVAGLVALLAVGLTRGSALVYTLGVAPQGPAASVAPGQRACQAAIDPPDGSTVERVGFYPRGGQRIAVEISPAAGGAVLARGELALGSAAGSPPALRHVDVGRVRVRSPIAVCFRNRGEAPLELWGTSGIASPTAATVNGKPVGADIGVTLERRHDRSLVALLPAIARRASVFHPSWASPAVYAVLGALILLGVPLLLGAGLRGSAAVEDQAPR